MNTTKIDHQARLNHWADAIRRQQDSGLTVQAWCADNKISKTQFYYWRRQIKSSFIESSLPDIVPVSLPQTTDYCLTGNSCAINSSEHTSHCVTGNSYTINRTPSTLRLSIQDITIEIDDNTSDELISRIIKAVRHA